MKKLFVFLMAAMLGCTSVMAQQERSDHWSDHRNTISISGGYVSAFYLGKSLFAWIPAAAGHGREWKYYGNYGLQYMYQVKWWFRSGVKANWEMDTYERYENNKPEAAKVGRTTNHTMSLVATMQFTYLNFPHVQLYSGLDLGVGAYLAHSTYLDETKSPTNNVSWLPAFNITPIGVAFGCWDFFGYIETNLGYEAFAKAGIGFHF